MTNHKGDRPVPRLFKKRETAELLRISTATLDKFRKTGAINSIKVGNTVLFSEWDIIEFLRRGRA